MHKTSALDSDIKNVLFVIHHPVFGGPHNQALQMAESLRMRGWETTVILPDEPGNATERLRTAGVRVVEIPLHRFRATVKPLPHVRFWRGFRPEIMRIRRSIRAQKGGLILIGGLINPHAALAGRLEGIPVVWQLLDTRPPMALRRLLMPFVVRSADAVMSTGIEVARVHPGALGLGERLIPFFPPVDTRRFRPDPEAHVAARAELDVPQEAPLVGMVGNINPQKGHEYFVRAAALIQCTYPDTYFRLLGAHTPTQAAYEAKVRAEAQSAGLTRDGRLQWTDPGSRVAELLPAFDLFLLTSVPRSEGVPTVVLEAMACGVPVVATDVGAVREVVEDGVTGFVVPPLDPDAIARATLRILQDPALRRRMGEEGRRRAVQRYDVEVCADTHVRAFQAAIEHHRARTAGRGRRAARAPELGEKGSVDELRSLLVCPACRGALAWSASAVRCTTCDRAYPVEDGIPVLILDHAAAEHDELEHLHGHGHGHTNGHSSRERQIEYFDHHQAAEFEITRPHGAPALYTWLMRQKFRRSLAGLNGVLPGATALTVCGGSGMDGEFLARAGARVIVSDLSLGAAQRAQERARRYGLPILAIVADVEHLPFADRSVDLVYVHDGLHHIEQPHTGLAEMARVANRAVSITEPAEAVATQLAVRAGWATNVEEAGNRVARLTIQDTAGALRACGLRVTHAERYAMYYRHQPGAIAQRLSHPALFPLARTAWLAGNGVIGRVGNKLTVQAERPA